MTTLVCYLVGLNLFLLLHLCLYAWKGGNLAELAEQQDTMLQQSNQTQPNHVSNLSCHPVEDIPAVCKQETTSRILTTPPLALSWRRSPSRQTRPCSLRLQQGEPDFPHGKRAFRCDVCKIFGFLTPSPLSAFGTDLCYNILAISPGH